MTAGKQILTTAEAARLLGVSVRTAQLLIEGGSVPSWKTPGGHRRVYRADVESLIEGRPEVDGSSSAIVIVVAAAQRRELYARLFQVVAEFALHFHDDPNAALLAIGARRPYAVVVDLQDASRERPAFLQTLAQNPGLGPARLLVVGAEPAEADAEGTRRVVAHESADAALQTLRASVSDPTPIAVPGGGAAFPLALNEGQRLVALERSGLVDTPPEEAFDQLTWLAARTLATPISLITLLTPTRQWFKSRYGLELPETPRSWAFCNHTILQKGAFSVEDLASDPRFGDNPAVVDDPRFRFYAGAPVLDESGFAVGSLCIIDMKPRRLDDEQVKALEVLAAMASAQVQLRAAARGPQRSSVTTKRTAHAAGKPLRA